MASVWAMLAVGGRHSMTQPIEQTREFTVGGPNAAFETRRLFEDAAYDWIDPTVCDEARLLISELVSAVIAHSAPESIDVRLAPLGQRGVRGEVNAPLGDGLQPVRVFRLIAGHRAQLLDALADRWGLVYDVGAPYVWFELGSV
jgi:hypothetical protein